MANLSIDRAGPVADYTSLDYEAIREDLIAWVRAEHADRFTDFSDAQLGVVLLGLVAYASDLLDYHMNSALRETFAGTARRKENLRKILRPFGLDVPPPTNAKVVLRLTMDPAGTYPAPINVHENQFSNRAEEPVFFQPSAPVVVSTYPASGYVDVECEEGEYYEGITIGVGTGLPRQVYALPQKEAVDSTIVVSVGGVEWTRVRTMVTQEPGAYVYQLRRLDDGAVFVMFGDGAAGAAPSSGQEIAVTCRVGGGIRGRLARDSINQIVASHPSVLAVTNPEASSGGGDEATLAVARRVLPRALESRGRVVNAVDSVNTALEVPGVAKAYAERLPSSRTTVVYVAPAGGGYPTPQLKAEVGRKLTAAAVGNRLYLPADPQYRDLRLSVLLHVDDGYRAAGVRTKALTGLVNETGSGLLDFQQLGFGALDDDGNLLFTQTRLQEYFRLPGTLRAEIKTMTAEPGQQAPVSNRGNGIITDVYTSGAQRRRQFMVRFLSTSLFTVFERITGTVTSVTDTVMSDDSATFLQEGVDLDGMYLVGGGGGRVPIQTYGDTSVTVVSGRGSLYNYVQPGASYGIEPAVGLPGEVGEEFSLADGSVRFTVSPGSVPFLAGDRILLDVFPLVGDVRLLPAEYPRMLAENLDIRTTGGLSL